MSIINLKRALGSSAGATGSWAIGQSKRVAWAHDTAPFERDGMTFIDRTYLHNLLASEYPEFYDISAGYYGTPYFIQRNAGPSTGSYVFTHLDSNTAANTIVAVSWNGTNSVIQRSTNDGSTFSTVSAATSPPNQKLWLVLFNPTLNKWFIFYSATRALISSDGGATFVDTAITGLGNVFSGSAANQMRAFNLGSTIVFATDDNTAGVWTSTNGGTTWVQQSVGGSASGGKLTRGNGRVVLLKSSLNVYSTTDGLNWTAHGAISTSAGGNPSNAAYSYGYGIVWDGTRWIFGTGGGFNNGMDSGVPWTEPAPSTPPTIPYHSSRLYAYSANLNSWTYITRTRESYTGSWNYVAGQNWQARWSLDGYYNGPIASNGAIFGVDNQNVGVGITSPGAYAVYSDGFWSALIASAGGYTYVGLAVSQLSTIYASNPFGGETNLTVTQDNKMAYRHQSDTYQARITNVGTPAVSVGIDNNAGGSSGEGYSFTRIA